MAYKVQKPCKVCGKMYTPCVYCESDKTAFHWRTVACSVECAEEYFRRVEEARKQQEKKKPKKADGKDENKLSETTIEITDTEVEKNKGK